MKLLILDGNSIINRAFYGIRTLTTREGQPTNAIFGFLNILQKLTEEEKPDAICAAFDLKAPTFRHEQYALYKANRKGMPDELAAQLEPLKQVLRAMQIPIYTCEGWEADDVLGTAAAICEKEGWQCVIATGDRDSLQLITERTSVRLSVTKAGKTQWERYTPETFEAEYGFAPPKMVDLKALMGDSSDNIPGVPGIGPKTASELLCRFGSLAGLYAALPTAELRASLKDKLEKERDSAELSYTLATIRRDAPIDFDPKDNLLRPWDKQALYDLFVKLEFVHLIDRYQLRTVEEEKTAEPDPEENRVVADQKNAETFLREFDGRTVSFAASDDLTEFALWADGKACLFRQLELGGAYDGFLKTVLSDRIRKQAHDVKPLMRKLLLHDLPADGFVFDTAIAAYLLDANQGRYELPRLTLSYLGRSLPEGADAAVCAGAVERLAGVLRPLLSQQGMTAVFEEIDLPLCRALAEMEREGVLVDRSALEAFDAMLTGRIEACQKNIYDLAGETFNIQSPKQLGAILFEKLEIRPAKKTKTGYATGAEVLEKLKENYPIVSEILDYRMLTKLKSTYAEGLTKCIEEDGRIRTTFQNTVTATGRLSSTDPNLQNIPVRTAMGSEIRKMFIARPGWVLVDADYSQIELRVLAHVADDKAMQEAFLSGEDFHAATAAHIFGVPISEVTPQMRRGAKAVNFGIVYGISEFSLADDLGVSRFEARDYIDAYLRRFSGVAAYRTDVVDRARKQGYVQTLFGRRRAIPDLNNKNFMLRSAAERIALNSPIQGTAADIMKIATIRVRQALREENLKAAIVLQVHDELIVECPKEEQTRVCGIVTREMQNAARLAVPLLVEAKAGESWYEAK